MTVIAVEKYPERLLLRTLLEFDAEPERIWNLWQDPRLLERWWGPPTHPATFVEHDMSPGGTVSYFMTAPDGERYHGLWRVKSVEAPSRLELEDFFADEHGEPDDSLPASAFTVTIEPDEERPEITVMTIESTFQSLEAMEKILEMGVEEGVRQAFGQIDALLASGVA